MKYYDFKCYDKKHYDFVVDTTKLTPEQAAEKVLEFVKKKKVR